MNNVIGVIACNYQLDRLREMTSNRPIAATPFGGRYAVSDFALSSMVNSGIRTVGFITPFHYRPILDHLGSGKEWDLDRKAGGLFILPGVTNWIYTKDKFSVKDLKKNLDFFQQEEAAAVLLSGSNSIFNLDFRQVFEEHVSEGRDCTFLYKRTKEENRVDDQGLQLILDQNQGVQSLEPAGPPRPGVLFLTDLILLDRKFLIRLLEEGLEDQPGDLIQVLAARLSQMKTGSYEVEGYFASIYSKQSYFKANMDLMKPEINEELFRLDNKIITRIKDNPPTRYGEEAEVREAIVSSGCCLKGSIEHSLLCRGVTVEVGARISNSIIMHDCTIGRGAVLDNVILDKSVQVGNNGVIKGDSEVPLFIPKSKQI